MVEHKKIVLFLGAGASRALGYPLTKDILPLIRKRLVDGSLFKDTGDEPPDALPGETPFPSATKTLREDLKEFLPSLLDEKVLADEQLPWITDVLSLVDHMRMSSVAPRPSFPASRLSRLRHLLERAIAATIHTPMDEGRARSSGPALDRFIAWILARMQQHPGSISIITSNYDWSIEGRLNPELVKKFANRNCFDLVDYGFNPREPDFQTDPVRVRPANPALRLLRLHGSLNWLRCDLCGYVYINSIGPIDSQAWRTQKDDYNSCQCGHWPLQPVLVAPSMVREIRDPNLLGIWQAAFETLRLADEWNLIGYSLPSEDLDIRSLLLRAATARETQPKIKVVENGDRPEVLARYRLLFGDVMYEPGGFETFINSFEVGQASSTSGAPSRNPN